MKCPQCNNDLIKVSLQFSGEYDYCRTCKKELKDLQAAIFSRSIDPALIEYEVPEENLLLSSSYSYIEEFLGNRTVRNYFTYSYKPNNPCHIETIVVGEEYHVHKFFAYPLLAGNIAVNNICTCGLFRPNGKKV